MRIYLQTQWVRGLQVAGTRQRGDVASPRAAGKGSCETTTSRLTVQCSRLILLWVRSSKGAQNKIRQINVGKTITCGSYQYPEHWTSCKICWCVCPFLAPFYEFLTSRCCWFCISCVGLYFRLVLLSLQSSFALDQRSPKGSQ